jgi:flagellar biosynthesis protein FlhA
MNIANSLNGLFNSTPVRKVSQSREVLIVLGVVAILAVMIVPVPTMIMDMLLALNMSLALVVLLSTMYNLDPVEFSVFPSLLLTVTLFRLSLNVATTRLILSQADAGQVIQVFGTFVTKGNEVVGFIIFVIIIIVQFVVVTRGARRIAEVSARFTLDAMPGKQMAIDADMNSGIINEEQARERREKVSQEAEFHGAMDGASRFVQGDAIAGILIVLINIIGGLIIGVAQMGMDFGAAVHTYTRLTIGDGLVTQIPALMVSTGSGILVSRAAKQANLGEELGSQLFKDKKVLAISGVVMLMFALIPGFPKIPFIALGVATLAVAYAGYRNESRQKEIAQQQPPESEQQEEKPEDYLYVDPLELEIGYGLIPLVDRNQGGDLLDRITMIRRQLAQEFGIIIPPVRIRDNIQLKPNEYKIKIRTLEVGTGELMSGAYLAMDPGTATKKIKGVETVEPAFGLPALWVTESQKEEAEIAGYTVVELPAVLATHLTEIIKSHAYKLLSRQDVQNLVDNIKETHPAVVNELIPNVLSLSQVHNVLQNLLYEKVPIRDLPLILETLADFAPKNKNIEVLSEYVRNALSEQICAMYKDDDNIIPVITLDPAIEARFEQSLQESDLGFRIAVPPGEANAFLEALGAQVDQAKQKNETPVLICSPTIRSTLKRLTESAYPDLVVLSYNEITPDVQIRSLGMVTQRSSDGNQQQRPGTSAGEDTNA